MTVRITKNCPQCSRGMSMNRIIVSCKFCRDRIVFESANGLTITDKDCVCEKCKDVQPLAPESKRMSFMRTFAWYWGNMSFEMWLALFIMFMGFTTLINSLFRK